MCELPIRQLVSGSELNPINSASTDLPRSVVTRNISLQHRFLMSVQMNRESPVGRLGSKRRLLCLVSHQLGLKSHGDLSVEPEINPSNGSR